MLTRREFLKNGVTMVGASAFLPAVFQKALVALHDQQVHGGPADDGRVLVIVQMAGGNDGLNTVIPSADGLYNDYRQGIGVAQAQALPLTADTALHPSMTKLKELWDLGLLAIVEGVGYPNQNFSHFVSMDIWQTADPGHKLQEGWLGRYFERNKDKHEAPFLGLAIGRSLPLSFETPALTVPSLENLNAYQFQGDPGNPAGSEARLRTLMSIYEQGSGEGQYGPLLSQTIKTADVSVKTLQTAHAAYQAAVEYPQGTLAASLRLVAEAIAADVGVKVCHVSIGGFDTHANQNAVQPRLLASLADSLHAFYMDLKAHSLDSKVAVMTWSEFGRRVKSNASAGTDHGSAAPLFFLGTPVRGGLFGQKPSLANLDNGNLRYTVDFRSAYATALGGWLGAPADELLGTHYEPLPLLRAPVTA